jgi:hypothetical protein
VTTEHGEKRTEFVRPQGGQRLAHDVDQHSHELTTGKPALGHANFQAIWRVIRNGAGLVPLTNTPRPSLFWTQASYRG